VIFGSRAKDGVDVSWERVIARNDEQVVDIEDGRNDGGRGKWKSTPPSNTSG